MSEENEVVEGIGGARTDLTNALVDFGKKSITDSVAVINDFIKTMIPLTTGLITVYFALLEFIGAKTAVSIQIVNESGLIQPPMFLLSSLIAFIITLFPVFMKFDVGNIPSITKYRIMLIRWRYIGALVGMVFFLFGLYLIIITVSTIISSSNT